MADELSSKIETAEFLRSSGFSRWLRRQLRGVILPRVAANNRDAYGEQFDDASRNVEIAIEGLLHLFKNYPAKAIPVAFAIADWRLKYSGAARASREEQRYLVYTQHDRGIPFRPEDDTVYAYMVGQIAYIAKELARLASTRQMWRIVSGFTAMNELGVSTYRLFPSLTPRYWQHERLTLSVVQSIDEPVNCCPSLHIAYSIYMDNVAQFVIKPVRKKREVFDAIRFSTVAMFNSVLYTKQHSLIDVGFGILCAKLAFEGLFDFPFDNFLHVFEELKSVHPIPYDQIETCYHRALELYEESGDFSVAVGTYLETEGFPRIDPHLSTIEETGYFDTSLQKIVALNGGEDV
jgi:hypothetical protein